MLGFEWETLILIAEGYFHATTIKPHFEVNLLVNNTASMATGEMIEPIAFSLGWGIAH